MGSWILREPQYIPETKCSSIIQTKLTGFPVIHVLAWMFQRCLATSLPVLTKIHTHTHKNTDLSPHACPQATCRSNLFKAQKANPYQEVALGAIYFPID